MQSDKLKGMQKLGAYAVLMRLDKPIGSLLLLWPTLWALWIAGSGTPDPTVVLIMVVGVFVMRSAGCVINDFADQKFDRHVERTRNRPLTTGEVSSKSALVLFSCLCIVGFVLVLMLNWLSVLLACAGVVLAVTYPYLKRFTGLPQFYLGIAFGWGIPIAFAAQLDTVPMIGWLLLLANIAWAGAYDTFYAMVDREDDLRIGIQSLAVLSGKKDRIVIGVCQAVTLLILSVIGIMEGLNFYYFIGIVGATMIAIWHQYDCRVDDRSKFFKAFHGNSWFGASVFGGIVLSYL